MSNYGIKISKPGKDVKSEHVQDLILTSQANQYKIHLQGVYSFTGSGTVNIAHGLPYTPAFVAFYKSNSNSYWNWAGTRAYVDGTNLKVVGSASGDKMSYVIFKDIGA